MKYFAILTVTFLLLTAPIPGFAQNQSEDWKGAPETTQYHIGALTGLGILDSDAGFEVLGTVSRKIVEQGFVPDINNSVSVELQAGPLFIRDTTAFSYSVHMRWDFRKDANWTLYGLVGVGGHITGESLDSRFLLFPRVGVGAFKHFGDNAPALRIEVSHERLSVGTVWAL